jgi:hypothetical protein
MLPTCIPTPRAKSTLFTELVHLEYSIVANHLRGSLVPRTVGEQWVFAKMTDKNAKELFAMNSGAEDVTAV